jgi:hypothetical protein
LLSLIYFNLNIDLLQNPELRGRSISTRTPGKIYLKFVEKHDLTNQHSKAIRPRPKRTPEILQSIRETALRQSTFPAFVKRDSAKKNEQGSITKHD